MHTLSCGRTINNAILQIKIQEHPTVAQNYVFPYVELLW
jgi:hypothetical protein